MHGKPEPADQVVGTRLRHDRIGVIAGGRLIAEGSLDELRRKAGKGDQSLEDTFLTLVAEQAEAA